MGLDITAYRKLTPAPDATDGDGIPDDGHCRLSDYMEKEFPGRMEGIAPGIYAYAEEFDFRAGSYSGYNDWREWLAKLAGYAADTNADHRHQHSNGAWKATSGPFWELINFSDNEGVIGPIVAAKLARDFAEFQPRVDVISQPANAYYVAKYDAWRKAFEMAADGGAVDFH